ncbi:hypothetical protein Fmac_012071 [Flemingia macrophylla]|uniref:PCI domain-containing protein n=1 Tax=Flemingia macrophylla TaxID=520843 RepID=A0ABD1MRC4_9FABA
MGSSTRDVIRPRFFPDDFASMSQSSSDVQKSADLPTFPQVDVVEKRKTLIHSVRGHSLVAHTSNHWLSSSSRAPSCLLLRRFSFAGAHPLVFFRLYFSSRTPSIVVFLSCSSYSSGFSFVSVGSGGLFDGGVVKNLKEDMIVRALGVFELAQGRSIRNEGVQNLLESPSLQHTKLKWSYRICFCGHHITMAIYEIPSVKEYPTKWVPSSLLNSTLEDKNLFEIPSFKLLLKHIVTMEVIQWTTLLDTYKSDFENEKAIGKSLGEKVAKDLRQRVIEHNILVVSKYYARITLKRLAELLCLSVREAEKHLLDMVVSKALVAKIDRSIAMIFLTLEQQT